MKFIWAKYLAERPLWSRTLQRLCH
jgi:hypothetical protein